MAKPTIAIVGLGVIGASLGLGLKKSGGNFEIMGHDREPTVSNAAKKLNAVDRTSWNLVSAVEGADLILLAIPAAGVESTLTAVAPYLKAGALVMDTCAVKRPVLGWAEAVLPETVSFVGGNPIIQAPASSEASADLFAHAIFCLCPSAKAKPEAVQLAADLASAVGAQPYFLDAAEHDGLVAGVEHLPLLLSSALLSAVTRAPAWREMRKLAGQTFERATDLPAGGTTALQSTAGGNADNLTRWIDLLIEELQTARQALAAGPAGALGADWERSLDERDRWLADRSRGFAGEGLPTPPEAPSYWKSMLGMGGGLFRKRGADEKKR